jgi:hypothetical protein
LKLKKEVSLFIFISWDRPDVFSEVCRSQVLDRVQWVGIDFKTGHRTYTIPSNVDEAMFLKCFSGKQLANDNSADTAACSAIVHPTTGRKLRNCREFNRICS